MLNPYTFRSGLGLGDDCDLSRSMDPSDPCYADAGVDNPVADATATTNVSVPCMPANFVGPLQPNQVFCATGTGIRPVTQVATAGFNIGGMTLSPMTLMFGAAIFLLVIGSHSGRR